MTDQNDSNGERSLSLTPEARRGFLRACAVGCTGAGLTAALAVPGIRSLVFPIAHETVTGGDIHLEIGKESQFKEGEPTLVELVTDRRDGFNRQEAVRIGTVWVLRKGESLKAYSSVCPHLGCGIDFDADKKKFLCPCHTSWFSLDGAMESGPSPRGMDEFELQIKEGIVTVHFQKFKLGIAQKVKA